MKKLNLIRVGAANITCNISTVPGLADTVWEDILRMDNKATKSGGNPNFLTITTKLSEKDISNIEGVEDVYKLEWKDLVRYIPSGSKIITKITGNEMKLHVVEIYSAPPMTTEDAQRAAVRLQEALEKFIRDISHVITLNNFEFNPYTFMEGLNKKIAFGRDLTLTVKTKLEASKFKNLDEALSKYKK